MAKKKATKKSVSKKVAGKRVSKKKTVRKTVTGKKPGKRTTAKKQRTNKKKGSKETAGKKSGKRRTAKKKAAKKSTTKKSSAKKKATKKKNATGARSPKRAISKSKPTRTAPVKKTPSKTTAIKATSGPVGQPAAHRGGVVPDGVVASVDVEEIVVVSSGVATDQQKQPSAESASTAQSVNSGQTSPRLPGGTPSATADATPVIFLAFANERDDTVRYLRNLPDEARRLRDVLDPAEKAGLCQV